VKNEKWRMDSDIASRILYCDSDCVVVNKIAGEAVEGAGKNMTDLPRLLAAVLNTEPDKTAASPSALSAALSKENALTLPVAVHRLDVPVTGCVVFARTPAALRFLNDAFNSANVSKTYWAIIEQPQDNTLFADKGGTPVELVHWIQFDSRKNKSIAHDQQKPGLKKAVLRYRLLGRGEKYLFLEIELSTGRHHQIRAQFERLGIHIKGDLKYGARRSEPNGGIRLHARSLSFPHPADKHPSDNDKRMSVQADPPVCDNLWKAFLDTVSSSSATVL
jgi:23S rRNA pseudouridine1911/1915/1917 synthase